ncbi:MAG: hypothetical protein IKT47_00530 [Oscillospiraceae bacterium]|nr:hypothetical protein [Oscillospiraceae bacterium]
MIFPSLLFTSAPSRTKIARETFDDLKMELLLSDEAISAMTTAGTPEDIPIRQELFRVLENKDIRLQLKLLARNIEEVYKLDAAYNASKCDNERNYLYFNLVNAEMKFFRNAAKTEAKGFFLERFVEFFKKEFDREECCKAEEITSLNFPKSDLVRINSLRLKGETMRIRTEDETTIVSRLTKCAKDLGISDTREKRDVSIKIKPRIINGLASLYPESFKLFKEFYDEFSDFYAPEVLKYRSELNFYLEVSEIIDRVKAMGMPICWPAVSNEKKFIIRGARDISLIAKNVVNIVPNDVEFTAEEPFCYLTGANGGGKTTYLRAVGITAIMFLCGCPLVCNDAELYPVSGVYTHFPRDERFDGDGRFADEQNRVKEILANDVSDALVLLNETYSTTNEEIATDLTGKLADQLFELGAFGIYITHQHGVGNTKIPFLSVIVDASDENRRTYRIERRRGASDSFALDILKKYGLTADALRARFVK